MPQVGCYRYRHTNHRNSNRRVGFHPCVSWPGFSRAPHHLKSLRLPLKPNIRAMSIYSTQDFLLLILVVDRLYVLCYVLSLAVPSSTAGSYTDGPA